MIKYEITKKYVGNPETNTIYINFKRNEIILKCMNKRCGKRVCLPMKGNGHTWSVNYKIKFPSFKREIKEPLNIWPSIHSLQHKEKCHYFIRNGKVKWED